MEEGPVSSFLDLRESKQSGDVLSPEDITWLDSCLVNDSEISDSKWDSLKDALLEMLNSRPETPSDMGRTVDDDIPSNEESKQNSYEYIVHENIDKLKSRTKSRNPFQPNYSAEMKGNGNTDVRLDFGFPVSETEPSSGDIFRVWDLELDFPTEEDELTKQLCKALEESPLEPRNSASTDSGVHKIPKEESLDDLVAGISDLSLSQNSG